MTGPFALPMRLGNYELLRPLAQGGMADIYLARQLGTVNRHVAVKVLDPDRAGDSESRALFLDEARLLAMLGHANLATVYHVDVEGGLHYLAMEYVHGADLRGVLAAARKAGRKIPCETALSIVASAAAGLDHAHRRCDADGKPLRLVHRDVSLSNVMVGHDGSVKVIDFGIASATVSSHHTNPGVVRGKASYMSPEQALGDAVDLRTDVFALGVVLYELTTGRRCFNGATDFDRMMSVVRGDYIPPHLHLPDFPPELETVIRIALAPDAGQRYASAAALIEALERVAVGQNWVGGTRAIARLMQELFGDVPALDGTARASSLVLPVPRADTTVRPRRMARGTAIEPSECDEDAPTRGRRSVPRLWFRRRDDDLAA